MVVTGVETGLRNSDIRNLLIDDVDTDELRLSVRDPKGDVPYDVPISEDLAFDLDNWLQGQRSAYGGESDSDYLFPAQTKARLETNGGLNRIVKDAAERAGIQDVIGTTKTVEEEGDKHHTERSVRLREWKRVTVHTLRHTYLMLLKDAGVSLSYRQMMANHRTPATTRAYTHGDDSAFQTVRERFVPPR